MRDNKKIHIYIWGLIFITFMAAILILSFIIQRSINGVRMRELYDDEIKKCEHFDSVVGYIDEKAKLLCLTQYLDDNNQALMRAEQYDAVLGVRVIANFNKYIIADSDFRNEYIYNGNINKYFGNIMGPVETEQMIEKIKAAAGDKIPVLRPIPRNISYYSNNLVENVLTYIMYEETDENDMPKYALIVDVNLDRITNAAGKLGKKSRVIVFDQNNKIITNTYNDAKFQENVPEEIPVGEQNKSVICKLAGEKVVINRFVLKSTGWTYVNITNYEEYFLSMRNISKIIFVITLLFLILSLFVTNYISKIISHPIMSFVSKIDKSGESDTNRIRKSKRAFGRRPSDLLCEFFVDAEQGLEKNYKIYEQKKRSESIRNSILFEQFDTPPVRGYIILFETFNADSMDVYISQAFNMIQTYIESDIKENYDIVMLDKRRTVVILDADYDAVESICKKVVEDAVLCNVVMSAFIGRYLGDNTQIKNEYAILSSMSRYQLMRDEGMIYNYSSFQADEKKVLNFSKESMNSAIDAIVESESDEERMGEVDKYLNSIKDNNIENYRNICESFMELIQKMYGMVATDNSGKFDNINRAMSTAETNSDMLNALSAAANIVSEIYIKMYGTETIEYAHIKEFIKDNVGNMELSIGMIAEHFDVNQRKLSYIFRHMAGHSLLDEINMIRLDRVATLLVTTKRPVSDIMTECGFVSESNFYKLFKKHYRVTPLEYRKYHQMGHGRTTE